MFVPVSPGPASQTNICAVVVLFVFWGRLLNILSVTFDLPSPFPCPHRPGPVGLGATGVPGRPGADGPEGEEPSAAGAVLLQRRPGGPVVSAQRQPGTPAWGAQTAAGSEGRPATGETRTRTVHTHTHTHTHAHSHPGTHTHPHSQAHTHK